MGQGDTRANGGRKACGRCRAGRGAAGRLGGGTRSCGGACLGLALPSPPPDPLPLSRPARAAAVPLQTEQGVRAAAAAGPGSTGPFVRRGAEAAVSVGGTSGEGGAPGPPSRCGSPRPRPARLAAAAWPRCGVSDSGGGGAARAGVYVGSRCTPAAWRTT